MTTIATDGRTMAGDGARFRNDIMVAASAAKVNRLSDGSLLGCSGASHDCIALRLWIDGGEQGHRPRAGSLSGLHLKPNGELLYYSEKGPPVPAEIPATAGSGGELALGAMLAGASPAEAVRIAAQRDPYTGGNICVETLA